MERLIESVRKFPCLWKTDIEDYKLNDIKEAAWREVVKECDLPDVKEAKTLWRKLRDGHRQAISRKKTTTGQAANLKNLWKYEKAMEFLLPTMQNRQRLTNVDRQDSPQDSDVTQCNIESPESEQQQKADDFVPPKKKPNLISLFENEQKRREIRSAERDSLRRQLLSSTSINKTPPPHIVESTALEKFFMSMVQTTKDLSESLQLRVQRQLFNIVMEAKEEELASRRLTSHNVVHQFRGNTPFQLSSTPHHNASHRSNSTLSNYSDAIPSPSQPSTRSNDIEHGHYRDNYNDSPCSVSILSGYSEIVPSPSQPSTQSIDIRHGQNDALPFPAEIDIRYYLENENFLGE